MRIRDFQLERFFAKYEFSVSHLLSPSDCEPWTVSEIFDIAGDGYDCLRNLRLSYTESRGAPALIEAVSSMYNVGHDGVVIGCPEELIFLFMNSFLESGDGVVCVSPAYQSLYELPCAIGCDVVFWSLAARSGRWSLNYDELETLLRSRPKLLAFNFPHNPTGYMPNLAEFQQISDLAERYGVTVFSDEMYRGLALSAPELPSFAGRPNAVVMSGLSKGPGLPGLRLGWIVSRRHDLISSVLAMKDYTTICNSAPAEVIAEAAIHNIDALFRRNLAILRRNVKIADEFFARNSEFVEWIPPIGGSTAFPRLLNGDVMELCERAVALKSLMVLPDQAFDVKANRFRVGMGRKNFPLALKLFGELLETWGK